MKKTAMVVTKLDDKGRLLEGAFEGAFIITLFVCL